MKGQNGQEALLPINSSILPDSTALHIGYNVVNETLLYSAMQSMPAISLCLSQDRKSSDGNIQVQPPNMTQG